MENKVDIISMPHNEVLDELLKQIKPVDFQAEAFPKVIKLRKQAEKCDPGSEAAMELQRRIDKCKPKKNHLLIVAVEYLIKIAKKMKWGLCRNNDMVYVYNKAYWAQIDDAKFQSFLGDAAERMGVTKFSARFYQFQGELLKQFFAGGYLQRPSQDNDTVCINLLNGTYEIRNGKGELRDFNPDDFLTYQLPFAYDPNADAPIFQKYLDRVLPDVSRQQVLAEYLGYVFIKHGSKMIKAEKALILYGTGANGKSVFFEIVNAMLGPKNITNHPLHLLTKEEPSYYRADLADKLLNYGSEISANAGNMALFKMMVSGEPISARQPYGRALILRQYAKFIFNCNELLRDVEQTDAFFRRCLIIPFEEQIPEEEQDRTLHTKIIEAELPGVLNWALQGLARLLSQNGFTECDAARHAINQYRKDTNSVQQFLDDEEWGRSDQPYKIKDLYSLYRDYCWNSGFRSVGKTVFMQRLQMLKIEVKQINIGNVAYLRKK
jgi:phage/plasmid primase, P4 family, C-terminal domain